MLCCWIYFSIKAVLFLFFPSLLLAECSLRTSRNWKQINVADGKCIYQQTSKNMLLYHYFATIMCCRVIIIAEYTLKVYAKIWLEQMWQTVNERTQTRNMYSIVKYLHIEKINNSILRNKYRYTCQNLKALYLIWIKIFPLSIGVTIE
jgi:hypothetical protein